MPVGVLPFRLDAIFQDPCVALSLVQRQNVHNTAVRFDHACVDGCFTNAGVLRRENVATFREAFQKMENHFFTVQTLF